MLLSLRFFQMGLKIKNLIIAFNLSCINANYMNLNNFGNFKSKRRDRLLLKLHFHCIFILNILKVHSIIKGASITMY